MFWDHLVVTMYSIQGMPFHRAVPALVFGETSTEMSWRFMEEQPPLPSLHNLSRLSSAAADDSHWQDSWELCANYANNERWQRAVRLLSADPRSAFCLLNKLFLKMIAEHFHCSFYDGSFRRHHCAGAVPQLFISCQEHQTYVTLSTPLSDSYRNCTLPVFFFLFFFSDNGGLSRPGTVRWKQIPDCVSVSPLSCCHLADRLWAITCSVGILAE